MKYFFILSFIPALTLADVVTDCGEYTVKGVVRGGVGISIVVNEKTQSEYTIVMPVEEMAKIGSYLDDAVTAKLKIEKIISPVKGEIKKIISIDRRIPNPLNPEDTGLKLDKKFDCLKI